MAGEEFSEHFENSLVWEYLKENLDEFVKDVQVFSEEILANVSIENKPFVKSAGLAFYSAPIVNLLPEIPWETIKEAIASSVYGVFYAESCEQKINTDAFKRGSGQIKLIEQAIVASFVSISVSAGGAVGAILLGGVANVLGKYIALYVAAILDEAIQEDFWPILQIQSAVSAETKLEN